MADNLEDGAKPLARPRVTCGLCEETFDLPKQADPGLFERIGRWAGEDKAEAHYCGSCSYERGEAARASWWGFAIAVGIALTLWITAGAVGASTIPFLSSVDEFSGETRDDAGVAILGLLAGVGWAFSKRDGHREKAIEARIRRIDRMSRWRETFFDS